MKLLRECSRYYVHDAGDKYYIREAHPSETKTSKTGYFLDILPSWYFEGIILGTVKNFYAMDIPLKKFPTFTYNWVVIKK